MVGLVLFLCANHSIFCLFFQISTFEKVSAIVPTLKINNFKCEKINKRSKKHILNMSGITKTREQHEYLYFYLTRKDNIRR